MYVCICNAVSDRQIDRAIDSGHLTVKAVYQSCGVEPQCGTCADQISTMIEDKISRARFAQPSDRKMVG